MKKIVVKDTICYKTDITVKPPAYMSDEEFTAHLLDAKEYVDGSNGDATTFEHKLGEMGFHIVEVESNKSYPETTESVISKVVDVDSES